MNTQDIIELDKQYFMNTFGDRIPVVFEFGNGCTLFDKSGKAYTDFLAGIAVNTLGYNHPALTEAIVSQASKLLHCSNIFYIEPQAQLAKLLIDNSCAHKVFFANSGAEANEGAIKLARAYFSKKDMHKYEIISANNSFHGRTLATLAATGQEKYQTHYKPLPKGFINVPFNDLDEINNAINENTCAIMLELIQGESGIIEACPNYIKGIKEICVKNNILLILDEVQTGIGRTGKLFAYEHYDIEPDIFTLAKGLGGGVPIGAIMAKDYVAGAFEPGDHGSTFGGNPLACSAAVTVLSTLLDTNIIEECSVKGNYFKSQLEKLKNDFPKLVRDVRGKGLMLGMELDESLPGKQIVTEALEKGFIINCAGHNTLRFVPPLIIIKEQIDNLVKALKEMFILHA